MAVRSQIYLDHLKIEEALQEPNLTKRAELLIPFCLYTDAKTFRSTQGDALFAMGFNCGQAGASRLVSVYKDPKYAAMQTMIMVEWENAQYHEAVPMMVDLLKRENQFWKLQMPVEKNLWFDTRPDHHATKAQGESEQRVEAALMVLQRIPDIQAKLVVEETKRLWTEIQAETISDNVIKHCNDALESILKAEEQK